MARARFSHRLVSTAASESALPPTGRRVEAAAIVVYEIVGDKIVRVPYGLMDWLTLLRQLGAASTFDGEWE